ncbi:hypothetical protein GLAREA_09317 [Glarea lozoyensis ATCC 20868]|uniref:Fungal N-terminal domain-containing protein n=1 Tax=Glarea lozoyensis (strain ATCC 20868 / MF5171) TaxID=1116229 RepID=S3DJ28_GLAL2|nr:uncharacterized protein GLAREA_09317 [Glarea lozoyensis ATCC 20868]EPE37154.1 hypothetical protein GLAREA_09317 [Glarea lozoyensis ATCC 20868]
MAEAIGVGASVVAFIGLAGQVAQGCQYIRTLLDDIKDASEDVQSLRTEVKIFQLTLETFRNTLQELADSGVAVEADAHALATRLALSYSEEALELLQGLLAKTKDTGRIWSKVRFASGKSKYAKHVSRIERAKGYIEAAHAGILLSLQHQQALNARATHRSLSALTSNIDTTTATISTLPLRFDEVSSVTKDTVSQLRCEFSQRLHDLSTGINAILLSNFTAFTTIISETHSRVEEVHHTAQATQSAVQDLRSVSEGMRWLPMRMGEVVKEAFRDVLVQFYEDRRTLDGQTFGQQDTAGIYHLASRGRSTRRIVSQHTSTRTYIRAVGIITVHSITTTFCERESPGTDDRITSTVTH